MGGTWRNVPRCADCIRLGWDVTARPGYEAALPLCQHPDAPKEYARFHGVPIEEASRVIGHKGPCTRSRGDRNELRTAPKWCPLRSRKLGRGEKNS